MIDLFMQKKFNNIKKSFEKIKKEMNEHLEAINSNTNEIQESYEYLTELDLKIQKLSERLDYLEIAIKQDILTDDEKKLFKFIYDKLLYEDKVSFDYLANKTQLNINVIKYLINSMILKKIPFDVDNNFITLDDEFLKYQTKNDVLKIRNLILEK